MSQGRSPRMIVSPVEVLNPSSTVPGQLSGLTKSAQWDTGADFCLISPALARNLRLTSCGEASINGVGGKTVRCRSYLVNLVLPNGIYLEDVPAIEDSSLGTTGVDFLIGLDVINELDFALTRDVDGNTVLSVSFPAGRLVDFAGR